LLLLLYPSHKMFRKPLRKIITKRGDTHEIAVKLYSWALILVIEAGAKILLAAQAVAMHPPVVLSLRVLVA
jgi:hypothetical protein